MSNPEGSEQRTNDDFQLCTLPASLPRVAAAGWLFCMDVTRLEFPVGCFDAAVASFFLCVLSDQLQTLALCELGRIVKPGRYYSAVGVRAGAGRAVPGHIGSLRPVRSNSQFTGYDVRKPKHIAICIINQN